MWQRLFGLALHDVKAQSLQFTADDMDSGTPRFSVGLGAVVAALACGVEVADMPESIRPVAGDPSDIRPCLASVLALGLGDGSGLRRGLFEEQQAGIGLAGISQCISEIA